MKKRFYLFALLMVAITSVALDGCKKKDDDEVVDARAKFIGTFSVTNSCIGTNAYICTITNSTQAGKVIISNMGNNGWSATGTVSGNNITLSGTVSDATCGNITIGGSGTINGIVLNLSGVTYTVSNTTACQNIGPCTETFTKQ